MAKRDEERRALKKWAHPTKKEREEQEREKELARAELRVERATRTNLELRRSNRFLSEQLEQEQAKVEMLLTVRDAPEETYRIGPPKGKGPKNPTVTVSLASDLHVEEEVDPKTVNGLNEYGLEIAEKRLRTYFRNVARLIRRQATDCDVREHIQWLGGDLFTGHINEDLAEVAELTPSESILWLRPRIRAGLDYLLENTEISKLTVACSFGNHGRTTQRPRIATAAGHSWEWFLYQILQDDYREQKNVTFLVSSGYHLFVDAGGFLIRFHHGDAMRYRGGVGGIHIPLRVAVDSWNTARRADLDAIGHWHTFLDLGYAVLNGSLIGYSPYAIKALRTRYEPPRQAFFAIDLLRKQKTGVYPVFVE